MTSIILTAARPILQGALGAAAAQLGLHLYLKSPRTPDQRLNAWAFTLIAGCAVGVALGLSAGALLAGAAVHTLMLLKERKEPSPAIQGGNIHWNNFPYPLPAMTEETAPGLLAVNHCNLRAPKLWYDQESNLTPCISTYVFLLGGEKVLIDFVLNRNMTLSTPNRDWLQLPVSVDKTSGQAKVEISADMAMQLALESNLGSNFEKSELIQRKDETYRRVDQAQFKVCGQTVYFGLFESGVWEEIGNEPSRYEIDGQAELFKIPKDRNQGNIYFLANNNLFKVAFCKFKGDLYLQDMWGMWDRVDKEEISDLSDRAEELTDSLGFSTYCLVKELPDTASNKLPGTISRRRHSLYVELPSQSTVSLSPTSTPLIYTYTLEIEGELVTTPVCIWENEHGQLALYPDDYARLCAHVEQADAAEQQEGQNDNSMGFD